MAMVDHDRARGDQQPGLVSSHTSGTPDGLIEIDPFLTRLRRMSRAVLTASRMHEYELTGLRFKPAMLTLTYRAVGAWHRQHISALLRHIRQWMKRRGHRLRYVWVAELQQRGALHYHVLLWLPRGVSLPKPDKQRWWTHGSTRIEWARQPAGYLAKYASKLDSKVGIGFPPGARLHGCGGLDPYGASVAAWYRMPQWAREVCDLAGRAVRVKGVGLVDRESGICLPSPWRVSRGAGGTFFATQSWCYVDALRDVAGPYCWLPKP
jgi:Inovirus Gp2